MYEGVVKIADKRLLAVLVEFCGGCKVCAVFGVFQVALPNFDGLVYRVAAAYLAVYLTGATVAEKCITWDCPKKMAQQFIQATLGIQDANKVLVSLRKKAANFCGDILASIAAKDLAKELERLINR